MALTELEKATKAAVKGAANTEYARGYHNGLVAAGVLTDGGEVKDDTPGLILDPSTEVQAYGELQANLDECRRELEEQKALAEEQAKATAAELEAKDAQIAELQSVVNDAISHEMHSAMVRDFQEAISAKDRRISQLQADRTILERPATAPGKYRVVHLPDSSPMKPWAIVNDRGSTIELHVDEMSAHVAMQRLG